MNAPHHPRSLAVACCALLAACGGQDAAPATGDLNLFTVKRDDLPITVKENAELQALHETIVRSEIEGQSTIMSIIPEGTTVQPGDKLVEMDVSDLVEKRATQKIAVEKARAALTQANKDVEILEKDLAAKQNTADSNKLITELEFEKFLGRDGGRKNGEAKNSDMLKRLRELIEDAALTGASTNTAVPATDNAGKTNAGKTGPAEATVPVELRNYSGLIDSVARLLQLEDDSKDGSKDGNVKIKALDRDMGDMSNLVLNQVDQIRLAIADLKVKEDTYQHSKRLAQKQFITRNELDKDELAWQSQVSKVALAWNDLDLLINYTLRKNHIKLKKDVDNAELELLRVLASNEAARVRALSDQESKRAEFELANGRLQNLDRQINTAVIRAPAPGLVVYARLDRGRGGDAVREGVAVRERQDLIILPDTMKMRAVIKVQEAQVDKVARGQSAFVQVEAYPGETFTGRVTSVAPVADSNSGWMTSDRKVYSTIVEIDGDNPDARLRSRMAAAVTIVVDTLKNALPVPLQAVRRDRSVNYVWKQTLQGPTAVAVQVGRHNAERVDIKEHVAEGDVLYLVPPPGVQEPKFEQPALPAPSPIDDSKPKAAGGGPPITGADGQPGPEKANPGNGRRGPGGGNKKLAEMTPDELQQFRDGVSRWDGMLERFRERMSEEQLHKFETSLANLRHALEANKLDDAQAAVDALRAATPRPPGPGKNGGSGGAGAGQDRGND
ncbi:MAG TPA: efflux RND transporter periplasmic adaptor subunit [Planctomycetota bacterium]|nr:efflux RND transporter periplasmic adaptor subunit [Planctomycetota bacterium]